MIIVLSERVQLGESINMAADEAWSEQEVATVGVGFSLDSVQTTLGLRSEVDAIFLDWYHTRGFKRRCRRLCALYPHKVVVVTADEASSDVVQQLVDAGVQNVLSVPSVRDLAAELTEFKGRRMS